jgi:arabinofuranan 3-O-arabinosyltransferase
VREIEASGLPVERTLVVPPVRAADPMAFLFTSRPESRACVPTLIAPDCDPNRYRPAEEATGIDREVTVTRAGTFTVYGTVIARADPSTVRLLDPFEAPVIMHGSSTYRDDPTVSPRMAYDGTSTTSWIADPHDPEPTLVVDFRKPRRIDKLSVSAPATPGVAPASATLVSGDQTRHVDLGGFGTFDPLVTRHVEIRFDNPTRAGRPIGVGDVQLGPKGVDEPLDGAARTGAVCGFGPNVYVDGRRYLTKVDGVMGDVSSAGPLNLSLCDQPVEIGPGAHHLRIESTNQFQPVRVVLAEPGLLDTRPVAEGPEQRQIEVLDESGTAQRARIGPGAEALLVTGRNWNAGWTATLGGRTLVPQRVDGWAQGWRVPAGQGGTLRVVYSPQRPYLLGLVGGLGVAVTVLVCALVLLWRRGLRPASPEPLPERRRRRATANLTGTGLVVVAGYVVGGLPGLVGAVLARLPGGRAGLRLALAGVLMVAGSAVTATDFALHGRGLIPDAADVLTGVGAVLALVLALTGPGRARD